MGSPGGAPYRALDEAECRLFRASRGNFGLVWVHSKGDGAPHYQRWTRPSADDGPRSPPSFSPKPGSLSHERPGGVHLCRSEAELASATP